MNSSTVWRSSEMRRSRERRTGLARRRRFTGLSRMAVFILGHRAPSLTRRAISYLSFVIWESLSEHRSPAFRLLFGGFILNDVPMLDKDSVLNAQNICGNPIHSSTEPAKSAVHDYEVSLCHDCSRLVLQCWWDALDEIEQTLAARCDMSAMLNVIRRPEPFRCRVLALVEQGFERFKNYLSYSLLLLIRPFRLSLLFRTAAASNR